MTVGESSEGPGVGPKRAHIKASWAITMMTTPKGSAGVEIRSDLRNANAGGFGEEQSTSNNF